MEKEEIAKKGKGAVATQSLQQSPPFFCLMKQSRSALNAALSRLAVQRLPSSETSRVRANDSCAEKMMSFLELSDKNRSFSCVYPSGNTSVIRVPFPGSLCSSISAWCVSAPCFTMDSPSPVPPLSLLRLLSTR